MLTCYFRDSEGVSRLVFSEKEVIVSKKKFFQRFLLARRIVIRESRENSRHCPQSIFTRCTLSPQLWIYSLQWHIYFVLAVNLF